jgi:membrane-bound lytic murein transglycosylase B
VTPFAVAAAARLWHEDSRTGGGTRMIDAAPRRRFRRGIWSAFFLLLLALCANAPGRAAEQTFDAWLKAFRKDAAAAGITKETLDRALAGLKPNPRVIELDRNQPEFTMTLDDYLTRVASDERGRLGHARLIEHRALLDEIGAKYGVQPRFIVALWGIESVYGQRLGDFQIIESLATLAHDGRRGKFFRGQLIDALKILQEEGMDPAALKGSWSGAMGQCQFIPSSYHSFAVDYDGDGKRDIWGTTADIFASIANYLAKSKWRDDQTWGREVKLPAGFDPSLIGPDGERKLIEWQRLGVRSANGATLPVRDFEAYLLQPGGAGTRAFLVYANFKAILRWNRSDFFGLAVGVLADKVNAG